MGRMVVQVPGVVEKGARLREVGRGGRGHCEFNFNFFTILLV